MGRRTNNRLVVGYPGNANVEETADDSAEDENQQRKQERRVLNDHSKQFQNVFNIIVGLC